MGKRVAVVLSVVLVGTFPSVARADHLANGVIDNPEQRVTGHALRSGADQDKVDVDGDVLVWRDRRGDVENPFDESTSFGHLWSKNLATRDEALVKTNLATDDANPRVSGTWVVWTDHTPADGPVASNDDIYACQLPCTTPVQVTTEPHHQMNPAVDGTTVVWEDYRNTDPEGPDGDVDGVDLFTKDLADLAAPETPVVEAPGNQTSPSVSVTTNVNGSTTETVAWRDARDVELPSFNDSDVWVRTVNRHKKGAVTSSTTAKVVESSGNARSLSAFQVAVSGTRLLWNEKAPSCEGLDCAPEVVKTCVVGGAGCAGVTTVDGDALVGDGQNSTLDLSGARAVWSEHAGEAGSHVYTRNLATADPIVRVDDAGCCAFDGRVDGDRFAWSQHHGDSEGSDVFWRDATSQPLRANSIGLGRFAGHGSPAADGDRVVYRGGGDDAPGGQRGGVWVTDLSAPRRHFPVTNRLSTDRSRPAIVGGRIVWSECVLDGFETCGNVVERDLDADPELDDPETDLSRLGPPDADAEWTAWRCGDSELCVHDGSSLDVVDVADDLVATGTAATDDFSVLARQVRVSEASEGALLVVWHELYFAGASCGPFDPCDDDDSRLHVLHVATGDDEVVATGGSLEVEFDVSGATVVWADGGTTIWQNTATGCGADGSSCVNDAEELETVAGHSLSSPSIDGARVAWVDCTPPSDPGSGPCELADVYTRVLSEGTKHLVTNESPAFVETPYVDGDRIYWVDHRHGTADVYRESVVGSDTVAADTAAPDAPTVVSAARFGGGIELAWTNPADDDFVRVRILRKSGATAPANIADTSATIVFEGLATTFTDLDVAPGVTYSYAIFAFDFEPNFSSGAPASATA